MGPFDGARSVDREPTGTVPSGPRHVPRADGLRHLRAHSWRAALARDLL